MKLLSGYYSEGVMMLDLKGAGTTQFQGIVHACVIWYSMVAIRSDSLVQSRLCHFLAVR